MNIKDLEYKNKKLDSDDPFKVDVDDLKIFGTLKEDYCAVGDDNKDNFDFDSSDEKSIGSDLNDSDSYEKYVFIESDFDYYLYFFVNLNRELS